MKVYIVFEKYHDWAGIVHSEVDCVFIDEEKSERYVKEMNETSKSFYYSEGHVIK